MEKTMSYKKYLGAIVKAANIRDAMVKTGEMATKSAVEDVIMPMYQIDRSTAHDIMNTLEIENLTGKTVQAWADAKWESDKQYRSAQFEAKKQARIDRLNASAERKQKEADARYKTANQMMDNIPLGQPILIGHYSEKRDRAYRARMRGGFAKAFELMDEAKGLSARASAAEDNDSIRTDDPLAIDKLKAKLERLQSHQDLMKAANKLVKKNDKEGLAELGYSDAEIEDLFTPDCFGGIGYAHYKLSNNNGMIGNIKKRIEHLEAHQEDSTTSETLENEVKWVDNVEDNRFQLFFSGKPSEEIRTQLKQAGFRWSPYNGCWQAYRGRWNKERGLAIAQMVTK